MNKIHNLFRDFISEEQRQFKFKIGKTLASSLSGFIAGVIFISIFWIVLFFLFKAVVL
jgi:hypothetical protein